MEAIEAQKTKNGKGERERESENLRKCGTKCPRRILDIRKKMGRTKENEILEGRKGIGT